MTFQYSFSVFPTTEEGHLIFISIGKNRYSQCVHCYTLWSFHRSYAKKVVSSSINYLQLLSSANLTQLIRHSSVLTKQMVHLDSQNVHRDGSVVERIWQNETTVGCLCRPVIHHRPLTSRCLWTSGVTSQQSKNSHRILMYRDCCCINGFSTVVMSSYPLRLYSSTTSSLHNCQKSPTELQQLQNAVEKPEEGSHDPKRPKQLFEVIRTALEEERETEEHEEKDREHNIQRNIRPAVVGDPEVITERLKELLRGVNHGNRAKLAEAITLSKLL